MIENSELDKLFNPTILKNNLRKISLFLTAKTGLMILLDHIVEMTEN